MNSSVDNVLQIIFNLFEMGSIDIEKINLNWT